MAEQLWESGVTGLLEVSEALTGPLRPALEAYLQQLQERAARDGRRVADLLLEENPHILNVDIGPRGRMAQGSVGGEDVHTVEDLAQVTLGPRFPRPHGRLDLFWTLRLLQALPTVRGMVLCHAESD
jgi:hypothetical protein